MKKLSDKDIENMIQTPFTPDKSMVKEVISELHISTRFPEKSIKASKEHAKLDLHQYTEEQAWNAINDLISCGVKNATIITGASGILKVKFQQWVQDSIISKYFVSATPINNGSFAVKFRRKTD